MKAAVWGIFVGISMAFSFRKGEKLTKSSVGVSLSMQILTTIIFALPLFL